MRITSCVLITILLSSSLLSQTQTSLTIPSGNSTTTTAQTAKPLACHLADASATTSKYFGTASVVYLVGVNFVLPVLTGFVLPIILTKLMHLTATQTDISLPATIVPVTTATGTAALSMPPAPSTDNSGAIAALSGAATFFGLFANSISVRVAQRAAGAGILSTTGVGIFDTGTTPTASGLSAKDIINILTTVVGAAAYIWNEVQPALCEYAKQ